MSERVTEREKKEKRRRKDGEREREKEREREREYVNPIFFLFPPIFHYTANTEWKKSSQVIESTLRKKCIEVKFYFDFTQINDLNFKLFLLTNAKLLD